MLETKESMMIIFLNYEDVVNISISTFWCLVTGGYKVIGCSNGIHKDVGGMDVGILVNDLLPIHPAFVQNVPIFE